VSPASEPEAGEVDELVVAGCGKEQDFVESGALSDVPTAGNRLGVAGGRHEPQDEEESMALTASSQLTSAASSQAGAEPGDGAEDAQRVDGVDRRVAVHVAGIGGEGRRAAFTARCATPAIAITRSRSESARALTAFRPS
jgi:hypothetical protein